ncbi:ABC transporter permease [Yinghuangia seranimata]|uniref:ABC transporter permease n=1 Tax=Yinghuangia seranimata TaxID=408067 RepID=UPI00248CEC68|nr:ABC transporter permease [Yinghuangia seranimata]MDI2128909.1 ABC transporter permease [Yinghuangia seranimata]
MGRYVARRLLQMIPVFLGTTFLIYVMVYSLPGDPISALYGDKAADKVFVASKRKELGLDDPLVVQYFNYLKNIVLHWDFGKAFNGQPVWNEMKRVFPISLKLATVAIGFEIVVGVALGVLSGLRRGKFADRIVLVITLLIISIPIFVLGRVIQWTVAIKWDLTKPTVGGEAHWADLMMPGFVLGALAVAFLARVTRTSIVENLRADYIRTATAKGLPRRRVITVHLLRNSMIPMVTLIGTDLGTLMGGAIVTEGIFNVPGVGYTLFQAIRLKEGPTVIGIVTVLVLIFLACSLIVDLLYAVLDPRIRYA